MGVTNHPDTEHPEDELTPTVRFELEELARTGEHKAGADVDAAVAEWEDHAVAAGTPQVGDPPLMSRTATIHDPMTTALLAEASRHDTAPIVNHPARPAAHNAPDLDDIDLATD